MTLNDYLICYACFFGAQLLHLFWIKIPALRARSKAANRPFNIGDYFKEEWNILAGAQIVCVLLMAAYNQLNEWKPEWHLMRISRIFFIVLGGWGTSILLSKWGVVDKRVNKLMDVKANLSDAITGGTTTVGETVHKAEQMGIDVSTPATK